MKKHVLGLTLFTVIISTAVFVKILFSTKEVIISDVTSHVTAAPQFEKTSCWRASKNESTTESLRIDAPVTYKIENLNFNSAENILTSRVELSWNGISPPPDNLTVQFNFFTLDKPTKDIQIASELFQNPFSGSNKVTKTFTTVVKNKQLINLRKNYYGSVDIWIFGKDTKSNHGSYNGTLTRVALNEDEKLAQAFPVLMIHEKNQLILRVLKQV
jgi:hypothetical protein